MVIKTFPKYFKADEIYPQAGNQSKGHGSLKSNLNSILQAEDLSAALSWLISEV